MPELIILQQTDNPHYSIAILAMVLRPKKCDQMLGYLWHKYAVKGVLMPAKTRVTEHKDPWPP